VGLAGEASVVFLGAGRRLHRRFPAPSKATGSAEKQVRVDRTGRDAIRQRVEDELLMPAEGATV
jgi:hypothetical protein